MDDTGILKIMKRTAKRMRLKGSRLLQLCRHKPHRSILLARAATWEVAAQFLEKEIETIERWKL